MNLKMLKLGCQQGWFLLGSRGASASCCSGFSWPLAFLGSLVRGCIVPTSAAASRHLLPSLTFRPPLTKTLVITKGPPGQARLLSPSQNPWFLQSPFCHVKNILRFQGLGWGHLWEGLLFRPPHSSSCFCC